MSVPARPMSQRTIGGSDPDTVGARLGLTPGQVPARLDAAALHGLLHAHRALGCSEETLAVQGLGFPVWSSPAVAGAPTLVFAHGLGHDGWDFGLLADRLMPRARCVTFDFPGFGTADKPSALTLDVMVQALALVLERERQLSGAPPVLVASSLGGHVALLLMVRQPQLVQRALLLSPGGMVEVPQPMQEVLRRHYSVPVLCARRDDEIVTNSRRIFAQPAGPGQAACEALAARKLAVHRSSEVEAFARPFATVVDDVFKHPVLSRAQQVKATLQVVMGDGDVIVPLTAGKALQSLCGATFTVLSRIGHTPHLEAPDAVAELVWRFASGHSNA